MENLRSIQMKTSTTQKRANVKPWNFFINRHPQIDLILIR